MPVVPPIPLLRSVASMKKARKFVLPVILPDGKCVIFGGYNPTTDTYTNTPEMFDPVAETWTDLPTAVVQRGYHGVALLLPDGRVWTAGNSELCTLLYLNFELKYSVLVIIFRQDQLYRAPLLSVTTVVQLLFPHLTLLR